MPIDSPPKSRKVRVKNKGRYATPAHVVRDYDLGRNLVFKILREKLVRSISIKSPAVARKAPPTKGEPKRAIRLIDLDSLESWLAKNAIEPEVAE